MLPDLNLDAQVAMLRRMLIARRFEEELIELAQDRDIGHFHVYVGQESTGIPALSLLEHGDLSFTNHRNHGHLIARGADPGPMYAEILGRVTGYCRGKGGTLHLASVEHGFPTTSSATGGCIPLAVGAGMGLSRLGSDRVSVCLMGDGALEEGAWHESANIAAMESLPVIFLCENNSLEALGQRAGEYPSSTMAVRDLTELASVFGIEAVAIDGLDVRAVHETMSRAVLRARCGEGPTFIEARTVRWPGNRPIWPELATGRTDISMAWEDSLVPEEHAIWHREQDGLLGFTRELLAEGNFRTEAVLRLDEETTEHVREGLVFALDSSYPDPEEALEHVFSPAGD
tara:strand:- start:562 stop:1593 length:1032 start_codon:yes stop_codon:yes gene_type:complete